MSDSVKSWTACAPKRERYASTSWFPRPDVETSHNSRQQITITLSRLASLAVAERGHFHFRRVHWGRLWNIGTIIMTNETARHVNETESDRRGIKDGWYAISQIGKICTGRFLNREDCQAHIKQERAYIDAYRHGLDTLFLQNPSVA
jgi:hypothetical protein